MNCREFSIVTGDYVNRTLDDETMKAARMHVDNCAACASKVAELEGTSVLIRSLDRAAAPADFEGRLKARLVQQPVAPCAGLRVTVSARMQALGRVLWGVSGNRTALRPVLAVLALFTVIAGSLLMFGPGHKATMSDTDWAYIDTVKDQHASFAGANPLADESAAALRERASDVHETM